MKIRPLDVAVLRKGDGRKDIPRLVIAIRNCFPNTHVKLFLCLAQRHVMKAHKEVQIQYYYAFFNTSLGGGD